MSPRARRVLQAILYEGIAIAVVAPSISILFEQPAGSALALSAVMSGIALAWNYGFNVVFERWESRQTTKGRSLRRRVAHGIGFEGGLALILVPVVAYWLDISFLEAFVADLGILVFFLVYTVCFTWAFDKLFGLPQSALATTRDNQG
ncbi:PACE efflux transporter [Hydrogenophaga sp.]|uniref:PACE efflux transporter n=1 Tax=Hydrogenophaga sp. TaxID=1904254 RepID=UPI003566553C